MDKQIYKCKFCNFTTTSKKKLFCHAVSHNEHLDISNFSTSFPAYYELCSLDLKSLDYFKPFKSKRDVSYLVNHLASIEPAYRFSLKECAIAIEDFKLIEHFFKKCIQLNLYPRGSEYISKIVAAIHNLNFRETKNLIRDLDDIKKRPRIRFIPTKTPSVQKSQGKNETDITSSVLISDELSQKAVSDDFIGEVKVSELHFEIGKIRYKKHILVNHRIVPLTKSIRKSIPQPFKIVKDNSFSRKHFKFYHEEDLLLILEACEEAKKQRLSTEKDSKLINGTKPIPWSAIIFHDYKLSVLNVFGGDNQTPFIYRNPNLSKSFNKIIKFIERACPMLSANLRNGNIINITGVGELLSLIPKLTNKTHYDEDDYDISTVVRNIALYPGNSYFLDDIKGRREFSKSSFLTYLSKKHLIDSKIYYLLESVNHLSNDCSRDEFGFLFTISHNPRKTTLIFENITDESRASIVFTASTPMLDEAIIQIKKFLNGDLINKRQKLAYGQITFKNDSIIKVSRILHSNIYRWRTNVNRFSN